MKVKLSTPGKIGLLLGHLLGKRDVIYGKGGVRVVVVKSLIPKFAVAQTWGEVILVRSEWRNRASFEELSEVLAHELVHADQWRKYGILLAFLYLGSSLWEFLKGRHYYWENKFEREARALAPLKYGDASRLALAVSVSPYIK